MKQPIQNPTVKTEYCRVSSGRLWRAILCCVGSVWMGAVSADDLSSTLRPFFDRYCVDCHGGGESEGGFAFESLTSDLGNEAIAADWERIFDRVRDGEMPPEDADQVTASHLAAFTRVLGAPLFKAHADRKATVLRRLNRREYQNSINDLFGTQLDLESMLPEDGRSHEFDNVGSALGLSMVHLQKYLDAITRVLDAAIESDIEKPKRNVQSFALSETKEAKGLIGKLLKQLDDGSVVCFTSGSYPSGVSRPFSIPVAGKYKIRVTGYAYQSDVPITFSLTGEGPKGGMKSISLGYHQVPPNEPTTIEAVAYLDERYMIQIEPEGLYDSEFKLRKVTANAYEGPGLAVKRIEIDGPIVEQFPSQGHRFVFGNLERAVKPTPDWAKRKRWYKPEFEIASENVEPIIRKELKRIATVAFRRPSTEEEIKDFMTLYVSQRHENATVEDALRAAISAIFCSPEFLYMREQAGDLTTYELASRLSYFLSRSTPDSDLLRLAQDGSLADIDVLGKQANRLIDSPLLSRFVIDFTDAWLNLREIDFTSPDERLFPEFDQFLKESMVAETRQYFGDLVRENYPVVNLVKSDFAMLNNRLAEHYGVDGVEHCEIRRVQLPSTSVRGGLLTQGSVLKVSANGANTSPVVRGVWVMERIMGDAPPPPPPGIPGVEPDIRGATSLRELLDKHRSMESCNACHSMIDPPGFAMECFDPIGGYRERFRSLGDGDKVSRLAKGRKVRYRLGTKVDASGEFTNGVAFAGFPDFRDHLASQDDVLAKSLVTKLLTFATGREMGFSDRAAILEIVSRAKESRYGIRSLIQQIVRSEIFRKK